MSQQTGHEALELAKPLDLITGIPPLVLVGAVTVLGVIGAVEEHGEESKHNRDFATQALAGAGQLTYSTLRVVWRVATGGHLGGRKRPWLRPTEDGLDSRPPAAQMGAIAAPKPAATVSLTKKRRRTPRWMRDHLRRILARRTRTARTLRGTLRTARAVHRAERLALRALRPVVTTAAAAIRARKRWPRVAVAAARLTLGLLTVGLLVPSWRPWTLMGLSAGLLSVVAAAVTGPHGLGWWKQPKRPDDSVYGPRIWVVLRPKLGLGEEEYRQHWLRLPDDLSAAGARIQLRVPWALDADDVTKERISQVITSRIPGEWAPRWTLTADPPHVEWRHKPKPKPDPEPPAWVDVFDPRVQEILTSLKEEEFFLGFDEHDSAVIRKMTGENAHWAYSIGSGGGKSTTLQWLAVQMLMKGGTIVGIDPKLISLAPLEGVDGVHLYKDPNNALDMRDGMEWVADVVAARFHEVEQDPQKTFPPLYLFLEESNELSGLLKAVWRKIRIKTGEEKDPEADPIWEDTVAYILRFGRAANVHTVAVFQDFKDNTFGGTSLQPLFRVKILGNYDLRQWERITGLSKSAAPPNVDKAGRMVVVEEGKPRQFQTPYLFLSAEGGGKRSATEGEATDIYHSLYRELREKHGRDTEGLYSDPPTPSPKGVPRLLRARMEQLSRDPVASGATGGSEGGLSDETAGGDVTETPSVTADGASVTDLRDRLPQQAQASADATAPPELLLLAEISRRLSGQNGVPSWDTIRAHKSRRSDFPEGIEIDGKMYYTESQFLSYYAPQEKEKDA